MIEARQRSEPSFCRGPGEVFLAVGIVGGARLSGESGRNPLGVEVAGGARLP